MALFYIELRGDKELIARLTAMPPRVHDALVKKVSLLTADLYSKVIDKLSDDVLHVRTGELRRSIHPDTWQDGKTVRGTVFSASNSPAGKYAAIQEFGGTVHIPEIVPTKAQVLHFLIDGKDVFAMRTRAHDITIPERSYMRSSLTEMKDEILAGLTDAVKEGLRP
jgi:hypothetical protein